MRFTLGRRTLATLMISGAAAFAVTSTAAAETTIPAPKPTTSHVGGFFGGGLFKTVFAIFDAVRTETPKIAAPVIADAVKAGEITQAQADELTALLSSTTSKSPGLRRTRLAPEQRAVLRKVMTAVMAKLPEIAKPVIDKAVADGKLTQKQADLITKVIGLVASFKPMSFVKPPSDSQTTVKSPIAALEKQVTKKVKKAAKRKASKKRKARRATR